MDIAGFLLISKPKDRTSFSVVKQIRRLVGKKVRVGHTGTLDPFATGLLIIAIDRTATKHCDAFLTLDKVYRATGKLGELTDTLDLTGDIIKTAPSDIPKNQLSKALEMLGSSYLQTAPIYAALKYKGVPLYTLARKKKLSPEELDAIVKTKQRMVSLYSLKLLDISPPFFTIEAHVSHGTYIRSLINDIAKKADTIATTYELERTHIGPFSLEQAHTLEELETKEAILDKLIPVHKMLEIVAPSIKKL